MAGTANAVALRRGAAPSAQKTARMAAIYHFKFCRAILVGFRRQLQADGVCKDGFVGMLEAGHENTEVVPSVEPLLHVGLGDHILFVEVDRSPVYRDDLTGQIIDRKLVHAARQKGLDFFNSKSEWSLRVFEVPSEDRQATCHCQMGGRQQR